MTSDIEIVSLLELIDKCIHFGLIREETPGVYFDTEWGTLVSGPAEDPAETFTEPFVKNNRTFIVGETTGRAYELTESGKTFVGFHGVDDYWN
jgi:hypothetical protein